MLELYQSMLFKLLPMPAPSAAPSRSHMANDTFAPDNVLSLWLPADSLFLSVNSLTDREFLLLSMVMAHGNRKSEFKKLAINVFLCQPSVMFTYASGLVTISWVLATLSFGAEPVPKKSPTMTEVLAASKPGDWRGVDPENTIYLELRTGRVVIALAPAFAPNHVANIKALVREHYFDGLAFLRCQDNYVVQWGDPDAEKADKKRKILVAKATLPPEFDRALDTKLPFTKLPDGDDVYAREVGFSEGFPVARDPKTKKMWLVHCYGMVGAGRDNPPDSGGGTELYVVIGQAPRHLDRNVTLVGRVVQGMELLSSMPRGTAAMGFYDKPEQRTPIKAIRVAADVPVEERARLEVLRTDTPTFQALIESRRNRREEWFHSQAGHIEVCNVPIPVRESVKTLNR